jgi:hypothetical protein
VKKEMNKARKSNVHMIPLSPSKSVESALPKRLS